MTCVVSRRVRIPKSLISKAKVDLDLVISDTRTCDFGTRASMKTYEEFTSFFLVPKAYGLKYIRENNLQYTVLIPEGDRIDVTFKGRLRESQIPVVDEAMSSLARDEGAVLNLYCGFGKTTCANMVSCRLGLKTLVLVHTSALAEQWKERIEEFVEGSSVGIIRQKTFDVEGRTHVIGLMQSISKRKYEKGTFDSFGLMVIDECHHVCAEQLSKCIAVSGTKYRLGLSATPFRKDGFHPFLWSCIGDIAVTLERSSDTQELLVEAVLVTNGPSKVHTTRRKFGKSVVNMSRMVSDLCHEEESRERTSMLTECISAKVGEGRHVIVLSDRRKHLETLGVSLTERNINHEFMVGGKKNSATSATSATSENSSSFHVILATYAFTSEGVDIPSLDTAVFATPRSDVVQTTGRILRKYPDKKIPLVVDFVDSPFVFRNQFKKRKAYYESLGGKIEKKGPWAAKKDSKDANDSKSTFDFGVLN